MRQLHDLTKEELISIIQDYQELVSEIESITQDHYDICNALTLDAVQKALSRWVYKDENSPASDIG